MLFSEWMRKEGFWVMDFLCGSKIRRHYLDIQEILLDTSSANSVKKCQEYLNSILMYATENVEFYKQFKGYSSLASFPVINKCVIKNNFDAFQSREFMGMKVHDMYTSGSTGTPFLVKHDQNKRKRVYAEMLYFWGKAGYQIGMRYIFFRIWVTLTRKTRWTTWSRNLIMWDIQRLDNENLENIRRKLKSDRRIRMMLGYAGTLDTIANYLLTSGDTPDMFHLRLILSGAEVLTEATRQKLQKVFNCTVVSVYPNQENGTLAAECVEHKEFHVNSASYKIELLKYDCDEPVGDGEPGRVVVTDYFNHAMPLIRYDTGDIGTWKRVSECGWHTQAFTCIQGRLADFVYDTSGRKVSPFTIATCLCTFNKLLQFQFIQEGKKLYVLRLNGAKGNYENEAFVKVFKEVMGQDAEILIEHVHEIPVLKSGKRKEVICNFNEHTETIQCSEGLSSENIKTVDVLHS